MDAVKTGIFIQEQRKKKQLSQKQLSEYMFVSPTTVCKWEKGIHTPDISNLQHLADLFQISVQELIDGEIAAAPVAEIVPPAREPHSDFQTLLKKYWKKATTILAVVLLLVTITVMYIDFASKPRFKIIECYYPSADDLGSYTEDFNSEDLFCIIVEYSGIVEDDDFSSYDSIIYEEYGHYLNKVDILAISYFPEYDSEIDTIDSCSYICFYYS